MEVSTGVMSMAMSMAMNRTEELRNSDTENRECTYPRHDQALR